VNPYLADRLVIAQIDELHRQAARQRLIRRIPRSRRRSWRRRLRLPTLGVSLWPRERPA
jgi:hypothetical protein